MSHRAERVATYQDLIEAPDHVVAEIINGRLQTHPRPHPKHAWASSRLGGELDGPFNTGRGGPGGWIIVDEPEIHLGGQVLVPDLAGWRRARLPKLPDAAWFELAPDWVCEVISPSTGRVDRAEKMPIYADWLVSHLWLIDPEQRTLEVYALEGNRGWLLLTTLQEDAEVRQPPFDALSFGLSGLWG